MVARKTSNAWALSSSSSAASATGGSCGAGGRSPGTCGLRAAFAAGFAAGVVAAAGAGSGAGSGRLPRPSSRGAGGAAAGGCAAAAAANAAMRASNPPGPCPVSTAAPAASRASAASPFPVPPSAGLDAEMKGRLSVLRCFPSIWTMTPISWSRWAISSSSFLASASRAALRLGSAPPPAPPPGEPSSVSVQRSRSILKEARSLSTEPHTNGSLGSALCETYCRTMARHLSTSSSPRAPPSPSLPSLATRTSSLSCATSRFRRVMSRLGSSSSLTLALFWICATRCAKLQVEIDSCRFDGSVAMQPIMVVLQLPPRESRKTLVIMESR
mmetsp:Transcript_97704/g.301228  ORF Transcript_97704/g.301228 Transcript_97704/m.301228 type:complete len:328 (+) Transcript_97704:896-1879(+)